MSNDNTKQPPRTMSPIGAALFEMAKDMGAAQARIWQSDGYNSSSNAKVQAEIDRLQGLHQPLIIDAMRRQR